MPLRVISPATESPSVTMIRPLSSRSIICKACITSSPRESSHLRS